MRNMLLKDPERMTELFALLHKDQSALYQEKELNEAINNALLLEAEEHSIIASGRYSIDHRRQSAAPAFDTTQIAGCLLCSGCSSDWPPLVCISQFLFYGLQSIAVNDSLSGNFNHATKGYAPIIAISTIFRKIKQSKRLLIF